VIKPADSHLLHPFVSKTICHMLLSVCPAMTVRFLIRVEDFIASTKSKFIQYVQVMIGCFVDAYEFRSVIYEHA
jgi:hypothetical protein